MYKGTLVLAVVFTFLLVTPTLAQQWQTFYLDPSDPHWVKEWDPKDRLIDAKDRWISNRVKKDDPSTHITFKIPEFSENGGYIKFHYAQTEGVNLLVLLVSQNGIYYDRVVWRNNPEIPTYKTEATVKIPPGYVYLRFVFRDDERPSSTLVLWKEIQFMTFGAPAPTPTPPSPPRLGAEGSGFLIACIAVAIATLTVARLKKV